MGLLNSNVRVLEF